MPNPVKFKDEKTWMKACMATVKTKEGKPQKQAVAQCLNMWKSKNESYKVYIENFFEDKE